MGRGLIDFDRLRSDMEEESMGAAFGAGFGGALFEVAEINQASDDELIQIAERQGIDLSDYEE